MDSPPQGGASPGQEAINLLVDEGDDLPGADGLLPLGAGEGPVVEQDGPRRRLAAAVHLQQVGLAAPLVVRGVDVSTGMGPQGRGGGGTLARAQAACTVHART